MGAVSFPPKQSGCSAHLETPEESQPLLPRSTSIYSTCAIPHKVYYSGLSSELVMENGCMIWYLTFVVTLQYTVFGTCTVRYVWYGIILHSESYGTSESGFQTDGTDGTGPDECGTYTGNWTMTLQYRGAVC